MTSWYLMKMQRDGRYLYRAYSKQGEFRIFDSRIFDKKDAAASRCQDLNGSNGGSVGVCEGRFPIGHDETIYSENIQGDTYAKPWNTD